MAPQISLALVAIWFPPAPTPNLAMPGKSVFNGPASG